MSVILLLLNLVFKLMTERSQLLAIAEPLRDLNENRLSKFEASLLWVRIMEDFLQDDVQYNYVQLFNSRKPMMPDFDGKDYAIPPGEDSLGERQEKGWSYPGHIDKWVLQYVSPDPRLRQEFYREPLTLALANKFGHDGEGLDFNPAISGKVAGAVQTVRTNPEQGQLEFMPGFCEASIVRGNVQDGDSRQFDTLTREDAPRVFQTRNLHGEEPETLDAEIFYGSVNPSEFGKGSGRGEYFPAKRVFSGPVQRYTTTSKAVFDDGTQKEPRRPTQRQAPLLFDDHHDGFGVAPPSSAGSLVFQAPSRPSVFGHGAGACIVDG